MPRTPESGGRDRTDLLPTRRAQFSFLRFGVRVTDGPDRGASCSSEGAELAIGSAPGNQLVLTDPAVSRHHCLITATQNGLHLRDLGSTNGTLLAGHVVESGFLKPGSVLGVGISKLRLETSEDEVTEPLSEEDRFGRLLGASMAMRRIFAVLPRLAASESTVLLEGETGTGKGLLAEAIHQASRRASGPFVVVDCGSIPPTLIESELFGHERGAFTGANTTRIGAFEAARGGTIFLDEIGELPLDMQPKLLRALEERTVKRLGSVAPVALDVRVVAATNQDVRRAVNRGRFRSDLYYRLAIVTLRVPPLRERRDDVALLVRHFHQQFAPDAGEPPDDLVEALAAHDWPGNVRELRSAVERALLLGDPKVWAEITAPLGAENEASSPTTIDRSAFEPGVSFRAAKERAVARWEGTYVSELLRRHDGNLSRAARAARMDRAHLRELIRRYKAPEPSE